MTILYEALLIACIAELLFSWLPRWRPLQFAIGPLMLLALFGMVSPRTPSKTSGFSSQATTLR